ncbi:MAG: hypothetical protein LBD11_06580 [Candidatus Peribacteria bacterium]|jgi:hypothetical protein|nr:hypothetical protein [Candidatus Peribacteria bacterium]
MKQIKNFLKLSSAKKKAVLSVFLGEREYKKLKQAEESTSEAWGVKGEDKPIAWFTEKEFRFLEEAMKKGVFEQCCRYRGYPSLSNDKFKGTISIEKFNILLENVNNVWIRDFFILSLEEQQDLLFALSGERGIIGKEETKPKRIRAFLYRNNRLATFHEDELFLETEQAGGIFSWEKLPSLGRPQGSPTSKSLGSYMTNSEFQAYSNYTFEQRFYMCISIENFNRMCREFTVFM